MRQYFFSVSIDDRHIGTILTYGGQEDFEKWLTKCLEDELLAKDIEFTDLLDCERYYGHKASEFSFTYKDIDLEGDQDPIEATGEIITTMIYASDNQRERWAKKVLNDLGNILVLWHVDDVIHQARQKGIILSKEQAKDALALAKKNHDAGIGINWDVLDVWIDYVLNQS